MKKLLFYLVVLCVLCSCREKGVQYVSITGFAQGGTYSITASLPQGESAELLKRAVDDTLAAIDRSISGYNPGSVISRANRGENPPLDQIFIDIFHKSKEIWKISRGAFDPSCAPLFDIWGFGFEKGGSVPAQSATDSAKAVIGMNLYDIVAAGDSTSRLTMPRGGKLNFNAIAQGYSCDAVAELLLSYGCENYIIEIGGEIVCRGISARGDLWRIWIDSPEEGNMESGVKKQDIISITDCGLVTSGNYRKFYYGADGRKYSHTIDPATGRPVEHSLLSATVIAPDSATADAFATWFMVIGDEAARELLASEAALDGIGAYLVYEEEGKMCSWHTSGLILESEQQR